MKEVGGWPEQESGGWPYGHPSVHSYTRKGEPGLGRILIFCLALYLRLGNDVCMREAPTNPGIDSRNDPPGTGGGLRRVMDIFAGAMDLGPAERKSYLEEACAGDPVLRSQVEQMLERDAGDDEGLLATGAGLREQLDAAIEAGSRGPGAAWAAGHDERPLLESLPAIAGHYRILRQLGEGGMGVVYLAEQTMPRRLVAIKAIRTSLSGRQVVERFVREAHILARLNHPGIAKIYEAGIVEGDDRAFIVMEYVDGATITDHASAASLSLRGRVEMLAQVCDAVHHAHMRRVIHRDLKPANVLVASDGRPVVLDFGIARAGSHGDDLAMNVTHDGLIVGTPAYMAPEQLSGDDVDARADVYSLGVIAFQLLSGELPLSLEGKSLGEVLRIVQGGVQKRLAEVVPTLAGDLDAIVGMALRTDPGQRYQTANEMALDLRRHLAGEVIEARRDSAWYVLRKHIRRHRVLFAAAAVMLSGMAAFSVYAGITAQRERSLALAAVEAKRTAEAEGARANDANSRLTRELVLANIDRGRLEATAGNLPLAEDLLWRAHFDDPQSGAARWGLWEMYNGCATLWTVQGPYYPTAATISKRGDQAAMMGRDGTLVVFDALTGTRVSSRAGFGTGTAVVTFVGREDELVVTGYADGRAVIARADGTGDVRALGDGKAHPGGVLAAMRSESGEVFATGGADKHVRLWNAENGTLIRAWDAGGQPVGSLGFNSDGSLIATGAQQVGDGPTASIWRVADGSLVRAFARTNAGWTTLTAFSRDEKYLYVGGRDRRWFQFDIESGVCRGLQGQFGWAIIAGMPGPLDGPMANFVLVSGGLAVSLYPVEADGVGELASPRMTARSRSVTRGIAWNGPTTVSIVSVDGTLRRVDLDPEPSLTRIGGFQSWCFGVDFSPDGKRLAIAAQSRVTIVERDAIDRTVEVNITPTILRHRCIEFTHDGSKVVIGSSDGGMRVADAVTGKIIATYPGTLGEVYAVRLHPKEPLAAVGYSSGNLRIMNYLTGAVVAELPRAGKRVEGLAFSSDGAWLASTGNTGGVQMWRAGAMPGDAWTAGPLLATEAAPWAVAYSPDDATLASTTQDGTLVLFDARKWERLQIVRGHGQLIPGLAFSPDGKHFATGSEDGGLKLWEIATQRIVLSLEPKGNEIVGIAFTPDGASLAASTSTYFTALYDLKASNRCIDGNREYQRTRLGVAPSTAGSTGQK